MLKKIWSFDWKEIFFSILWAGVLALIIRTLIFEPYQVVSGSMKKTLLVGDYLVLTKYDYGYSRYSFLFDVPFIKGRIFSSPPKRGDIIIFKLPRDPSVNYIKRLIGLPGDEIQVRDGELYINNQKVLREHKGNFVDKGDKGEEEIYSVYEETLPNGVRYLTLDYDNTYSQDNTIVYKVPEGSYFFMGDNRDNSIDSRFLEDVGYIPEENLVGKGRFLAMTDDFKWLKFLRSLDYGRIGTKLYDTH